MLFMPHIPLTPEEYLNYKGLVDSRCLYRPTGLLYNIGNQMSGYFLYIS